MPGPPRQGSAQVGREAPATDVRMKRFSNHLHGHVPQFLQILSLLRGVSPYTKPTILLCRPSEGRLPTHGSGSSISLEEPYQPPMSSATCDRSLGGAQPHGPRTQLEGIRKFLQLRRSPPFEMGRCSHWKHLL